MKTLTCPHCKASGHGPRFITRHLVEEMCIAHRAASEDKKMFTHAIAQDVKSVTDLDELLPEKDRVELFLALATVQPYQWIDRNNQVVDLRSVEYNYAKNIRDWMLSNSYRDSPFDDTEQFKNVKARIERFEGRLSVARNALRKK